MNIINFTEFVTQHYPAIGRTIRRHPYCAAAIATIAGSAAAVALYSALNQKTVAPAEPVILPRLPIERAQDSLEIQFEESIQIDLQKKPNFPAYLSPNEMKPLNALPHLTMTQPGLIVSVGTERSFFDLALSGPQCQGLVVRDIHPFVKAYVDFNVLLLRIAKDIQAYVQLSTPLPDDADHEEDSKEYAEKIRTIQQTIKNSPHIPAKMQRYYLDHLEAFADIYFQTNKRTNVYGNGLQPSWRTLAAFDGVKYNENEVLFQNLQRHARAGNIIATVGDIGDLTFLDHKNIAIVDASNVSQYNIVNIRTNSTPTIINTKIFYDHTEYRSATFHKLTKEQIGALDDLLRMVRDTFRGYPRAYSDFGSEVFELIKAANPSLELEKVQLGYYSENLLNALTAHRENYCLKIEDQWVDFSPNGTSREWFFYKAGAHYIATCSEKQYAALTRFLPLLQGKVGDTLRIAIVRRATKGSLSAGV